MPRNTFCGDIAESGARQSLTKMWRMPLKRVRIINRKFIIQIIWILSAPNDDMGIHSIFELMNFIKNKIILFFE